jgi:serine/alanine adding enzyme
MNYKYTISTSANSVNWNNFLKNSDYSTFFQTYENITSNSQDTIPIFITVFSNNEVVGQLGLKIIKTSTLYSSKSLKKLNSIFSKLTTRMNWVYGPIIHSIEINERHQILEQILTAVNEVSEKYDVVHIEGQTPPCDFLIDDEYLKIFKKYNFSSYNFFTFITSLNSSLEEIWKNISKNARGDVNRAKRRNITTKILENEFELENFMKLNQNWAKTKGLIITDLEKEKKLIWNNNNKGTEKIFLAYHNNKLISGIRVGCFNKIAYTNFVINSYSDGTNLGGTLLTWSVLEWAKKNKYTFYDFSGGPDLGKNQNYKTIHSLLFYKGKWGGKQTSYFVFIKIRKKFFYKIYTTIFKLLRTFHSFRAS